MAKEQDTVNLPTNLRAPPFALVAQRGQMFPPRAVARAWCHCHAARSLPVQGSACRRNCRHTRRGSGSSLLPISFVPLAFRTVARAPCPVACGLCPVSCGLWLVACALWLVACGLWLVACGLWLFPRLIVSPIPKPPASPRALFAFALPQKQASFESL
jgi:hypothetical protein